MAGCSAPSLSPSPARTSAAITPADVRSRIYLIADDSMQGRQAGTRGNFVMTEYLAKEMERLGLEPGGENGTWFQTIPMVQRSADSASTLSVKGSNLRLFGDFVPIRPSSSVRFAVSLPASIYETVYGGRAGDSSAFLTAQEVAGRVVILDAPLGADGKPTGVYTIPAGLSISRYPGAAAIFITALDLVTPAAATSLRGRGSGLGGSPQHAIHTPFGVLISNAAAATILGCPISQASFGMKGGAVEMNVRFREEPVAVPARNVIAIVRGSDPLLRGQYVAVGAHSDHIGINSRVFDHDSLHLWNTVMRPNGGETRIPVAANPTPQQLARITQMIDSVRKIRPPRRDSISNGADDDGSGSVALLEIAESLASGKKPRRSVLLIWHTAEESGLLGSAWFSENPTVPHDSIVAALNMDMVGRGERRDNPVGGPRYIQVIGSRRLSTDLGNVVDSVNMGQSAPYDIDYSFDAPRHIQNRYCRSDHYMYARTGIPIAYISRGYHPDYHMVTDEPQYISFDGLAHVAGFLRDIATAVANRDGRVRVDKPRPDPLAPCLQ